MQRVVFVRSNPAHTDSRLMKETLALSDRYEVIVLGWDREREYKRCENIYPNITLKRLPLKAPYGNYLIILYYPIFWIWVIITLAMMKPDIVHACDFDALIPARIFRLFNRCRIVFDNFDKFAMAFIPLNKRFLFNLIDWFEDLLAYKSDLLIVVSPERLRTFRWIPKKRIVVMNCPKDVQNQSYEGFSTDFWNSKDFIIVYAGVVAHDRGLVILERVIRDIANAKLLIAGRIAHDEVLNHLERNPDVHLFGLLPPEKAIQLESIADVIPILYDPKVPINRVANPNKLFEAMMLGKSVISNVCRKIVDDVECGLIVDYNFESVKEALLTLIQSPESRLEMGIKGRRAFETQYTWDEMKNRLLLGYRLLQA